MTAKVNSMTRFRGDVRRDKHEGANVIRADFSAFDGNAEGSGGAFSDEGCAADAKEGQRRVAEGLPIGADG